MWKTRFVLCMLVVATLGIMAGAQPVIPRGDIVWTSGYWQRPGIWNPLGWSTAWGAFFMYEPLFQVNWVTGEVQGIIGESIRWVDPLTIEIVIRPEATWTDGKPITADDVIYTYDHLLVNHWRVGGYAERRAEIIAVSPKVVQVKLHPEYAHSLVVWETLTGQWLIVPKHVWVEIEKEVGGFPYEWVFANDWAKIKPEWRVASGMYLPLDWSWTAERLVRNDNWWGKAVWGLPAPKYIGQRYFETNFAANSAFEAGEIDWYSSYYPRMWELATKPMGAFISTWTHRKPPFFRHSATVNLVFNHNIYPLNEPWLRHAIAHAINYQDIAMTAASGYTELGTVTHLTPQNPEHARIIDPAVLARYQFAYDPEKAIAILEQHCIRHAGVWYTKDAPETWRGTPITDMLPDTPGRNVRLGPWKNMAVHGWTDSMMQNVLLQRDLGDIGIRVEPVFLEYAVYVDKFTAMDFDLMNFTMGPTPAVNSLWEYYATMFTGTPGQWANYAAYDHPEYPELAQELSDLLAQLDITPRGTPEEKAIAARLQEIIARDLPMIPMWFNGYWYAFSQQYWHNWPSAEKPYIFPVATWAIGDPGAMQIILRSLVKGPQPLPVRDLPWVRP